MCGRYSLYLPMDKIALALAMDMPELAIKPRYNMAPTQLLPVVSSDRPDEISLYRWGLIPSWAKDHSIGNRMINARAETMLEKNSFRTAARKRRCLVLADGFYEWKKITGGKIPTRISFDDGRLITFGGLWESWRDAEEKEIRSFTILTTTPNEVCAAIHDRMPVIIAAGDREKWLDVSISPEELSELLRPFPAIGMMTEEVSKLVNSPANDGPEILRK